MGLAGRFALLDGAVAAWLVTTLRLQRRNREFVVVTAVALAAAATFLTYLEIDEPSRHGPPAQPAGPVPPVQGETVPV